MVKKVIKVLYLSAEVAPLAKVGGLGDVAGSLPPALAKLGVDIRVCLPFYGFIDNKKFKITKVIGSINVETRQGASLPVELWETLLPGTAVPVYFIKHQYFQYDKIYLGKRVRVKNRFDQDLTDIKRFTFFTEAALQAMMKIDFQPDIIHTNDWHTSLVADLLRNRNQSNEFYQKTKILYTIHNLANQGIADPAIVEFSGFDKNCLVIKEDLKNGDLNFMVQGILTSDILNTVSPTYAREILTKEYGAGLDHILRQRQKDLFGVLNGVDTEFYNPAIDKLITKKYSLKSLVSKRQNKVALQKRLGLPVDEDKALVGIVSRLVWQKGFGLINEDIKMLNCQIVILGTGEKEIEQDLVLLQKKLPKQLSVQIKFDEALAHLIYAGADIFLMPSRYEPCGLGQMIAMRYGTVPVAHAVGGLKDTVKNFQFPIINYQLSPKFKNKKIEANGFCFEKLTADELLKTLQKALTIYYEQPKIWRELQASGMRKNFSWQKSAQEYLKLYHKLV